jgi:acetoin utilization deacetylase AcuC-like enzyme
MTEAASAILPVFYSPAFIAAAENFDTTRKSGWIAASLARRPIDGVTLVAPEPVTAAQLEQVHHPAYVAAIRTGVPRPRAESNGLSWDPGLWTATCASTGGAVAAVTEALRTRRNTGSLSSGLHHASAASGAGYCTFNGLALGAHAALSAGARRVLLVDADAHCGGGTMAIAGGWEGLVHVDVSVNPFDRYHVAPGTRSSLDIVRSADDYLPTIDRRLRALADLSFDVAVYNAGMDPHENSNGGIAGITFEVLAERERLIFQWAGGRGIPIAFTLAGGYTGNGLSEEDLVALHRLTIASAARANSGEQL